MIVDWSAAARPRSGPDSIWVWDGERCANPSTRGAAEALLRRILGDAVARGERVLLGIDVPLGYPLGVADALGLAGSRGLWSHIAELMEDDPQTNANNRFAVAATLNRALGVHAFWGCPAGAASEWLSPRRDRVDYPRLAEWRVTELALRSRGSRPQPVWKLLGNGSVGSQTLTALPMLERLRGDAALRCAVWPFALDDPGTGGGVVIAEVYPSLLPLPLGPEVRDARQVRTLGRRYAALDDAGRLGPAFVIPPAARSAAREEGWVLGV